MTYDIWHMTWHLSGDRGKQQPFGGTVIRYAPPSKPTKKDQLYHVSICTIVLCTMYVQYFHIIYNICCEYYMYYMQLYTVYPTQSAPLIYAICYMLYDIYRCTSTTETSRTSTQGTWRRVRRSSRRCVCGQKGELLLLPYLSYYYHTYHTTIIYYYHTHRWAKRRRLCCLRCPPR
jgi:hypothetical protein